MNKILAKNVKIIKMVWKPSVHKDGKGSWSGTFYAPDLTFSHFPSLNLILNVGTLNGLKNKSYKSFGGEMLSTVFPSYRSFKFQ